MPPQARTEQARTEQARTRPPGPPEHRLVRRQVFGLLLLAAAILLLTLLRANFREIFPPGWWRF